MLCRVCGIRSCSDVRHVRAHRDACLTELVRARPELRDVGPGAWASEGVLANA